jgi:alanyl-tRNA synthetase
MSEFDAKVISCERDGEHYRIILDKTAFFPCEGGQYADTGTLGGVRVIDVREKDGVITHITDGALEVGASVHGVLDFDDRFEKMQCHSGEHIVSGLIHKLYGLNNVGFHLGRDDVTLDFDGVLDAEQLARIEALANRAVYENIPIICEFPEPDKLAELDYRSKLELTENVRIVTVGDIDVCACCAPHVSRTGEIGIIKLLDFIHYKGGIRVHMLCGARALCDYGERYRRNREISNLTSLKQTDVVSGVERLLDENGRLKGELVEIKKSIVKRMIAGIEKSEKSIVIFEDTVGIDMMREYANAAAASTAGICAVFCKKSDTEYNFILASRDGARMSAGDVLKLMKEKFGARGGGAGSMVSGTVSADGNALHEFVENI